MSSSTIATKKPPSDQTDMFVQLTLGWHVITTLAGLGGLAYIWVTPGFSIWIQLATTVALLILSGGSVAAVMWIARREHRGRMASLLVNYLGFILSVIGSLHVLGIFLGIDQLANTFSRGVIWLFIMFLGYVVGTIGDRFEGTATQRQFHTAGRWIAIISFVIFLFRVGLLEGLQGIFNNLVDPIAMTLVAGILIFGFFCWVMWRRPTADLFGVTNTQTEMLNGYLFLTPNLIGFLIFFAGPLVFSLYVSFTNWDAFGTQDWVGLDNYTKLLNIDFAVLDAPDQRANEILDVTIYDELGRFNLFGRSYIVGAADKLFWISIWNTLKFAVMAVPLSVIPALLLANLLNSKLPGMKFFRAVYFLPSVAAVVGIALVWQWLYNSTVGYINYGITSLVNLINMFGASVTDPEIRWLSNTDTALLSVAIMTAWRLIGFNTVLFLAGLQNIPKVLYEAATVDGANEYQQFRNVTVPLLAPTTFFVMITTVVTAMQVFEDIFIVMPGQNPAGPGNSTLTMVLYLYQKGFQRFEQGYASAIAWVLFLVIFAATLLQFQRQRRGSGAYD
ncbi:MAG: sugar ABC transporter permease [Ardenticatenaceae bacterium]|nr:sugar ABC transporter permease [Ardenticatenaceae bacterium]